MRASRQHANPRCPTFWPGGSIRYDARTYRLMERDQVSLNTLHGYCHGNFRSTHVRSKRGKEGRDESTFVVLCCRLNPSDVVPYQEALTTFPLVGMRFQTMASRAKMVSNGAMG